MGKMSIFFEIETVNFTMIIMWSFKINYDSLFVEMEVGIFLKLNYGIDFPHFHYVANQVNETSFETFHKLKYLKYNFPFFFFFFVLLNFYHILQTTG